MYFLYPKNPTWRWLRAISTQGPKKVHNFLMTATSELSMRAWNWNVTDSKKYIFDLITPRYFPIWQSKEMSHDFVRGQSVAETCFYRLHTKFHKIFSSVTPAPPLVLVEDENMIRKILSHKNFDSDQEILIKATPRIWWNRLSQCHCQSVSVNSDSGHAGSHSQETVTERVWHWRDWQCIVSVTACMVWVCNTVPVWLSVSPCLWHLTCDSCCLRRSPRPHFVKFSIMVITTYIRPRRISLIT